MSDLISRVKKALEYRNPCIVDHVNGSNYTSSLREHGAYVEHTRPEKLVAALVECANACIEINRTWDISDVSKVVPSLHTGELARNDSLAAFAIVKAVLAIKKLEPALEEMEKK